MANDRIQQLDIDSFSTSSTYLLDPNAAVVKILAEDADGTHNHFGKELLVVRDQF